MPWRRLSELVENTERGWIDPNGFFWGAKNGRHHFLAAELKEASGPCLFDDTANWILVGEHPTNYNYWNNTCPQGQPNEKQGQTMISIGLDPEGPTQRTHIPDFKHVYPTGYKKHRLPFSQPERMDAMMHFDGP